MTFKDILDFPVEAGEVEPTSVRNTLESGLSRAKMVDWSSAEAGGHFRSWEFWKSTLSSFQGIPKLMAKSQL